MEWIKRAWNWISKILFGANICEEASQYTVMDTPQNPPPADEMPEPEVLPPPVRWWANPFTGEIVRNSEIQAMCRNHRSDTANGFIQIPSRLHGEVLKRGMRSVSLKDSKSPLGSWMRDLRKADKKTL